MEYQEETMKVRERWIWSKLTCVLPMTGYCADMARSFVIGSSSPECVLSFIKRCSIVLLMQE